MDDSFHNPVYHGDYIAQSKEELSSLSSILDILLEKKLKNELMPENRTNYSTYARYDIMHTRNYIDEKLSSANPIIFLPDLDDMYMRAKACIQKYSKLTGQTAKELKNIFEHEEIFISNEINPKDHILFMEIRFCYQYILYYCKKRKYFAINLGGEGTGIPDVELEDKIEKDRVAIMEILLEAVQGSGDDNIELLVKHLLSFKYSTIQVPVDKPTIIFSVSQSNLIQKIRKIKEIMELAPQKRRGIAKLFAGIPQGFIKGKPNYFNEQTIYSNI